VNGDENDGKWTCYPKRSNRVVDFVKGVVGIAEADEAVYDLEYLQLD
jgi:hypothetical protein